MKREINSIGPEETTCAIEIGSLGEAL